MSQSTFVVIPHGVAVLQVTDGEMPASEIDGDKMISAQDESEQLKQQQQEKPIDRL